MSIYRSLYGEVRSRKHPLRRYRTINGPRPGLLAVWHFDGDAQDAVGGHHGVLRGNATFSSERFPSNVIYLPLIRR